MKMTEVVTPGILMDIKMNIFIVIGDGAAIITVSSH